MNPLMNMMNPQQMLLGMLQQRNPQAFNQLQQLMQSGQNPQVLLSNMMGQPTPKPAYLTCSPYYAYNMTGCGCNQI